MKLKPCPCGKIPESLGVQEGSCCKYAFVFGDCCNEWLIEFRVPDYDTSSKASYKAAVEAWNNAKRRDG